MILVWGPPNDGETGAVLEALARRDAPVVFVNQADVLRQEVRLFVDGDLRASLELPDGAIDLREVTAAYIRPHDSAQAPDVAVHGADSAAVQHAWHVDERLLAWAEVTDAVVVNRPSAMASNDSKPHQSIAARDVGFEVPATLLTTDPGAARQFATTHGEVIYKSISGIRSIVTRLDDDGFARLDDVAWCPTQFQAYVTGTDVRAHVLGDRVFACEITSDACDYRYGGYKLAPCELAPEPAARCVVLTQRLGLELAGIDLRRDPGGRWYCFEANPSPAFTCFGDEIERAVADALADFLIAGRGGYCTLTDDCPADFTVITPPHEHEHCDESSSAATSPIATCAAPGVQGLSTGTQGCGVSVPAALVAAATWGLDSDEHIPNPGTLLAATSVTTPAAAVASTSVPDAVKVAGLEPKEHCSEAPVHTWVATK